MYINVQYYTFCFTYRLKHVLIYEIPSFYTEKL